MEYSFLVLFVAYLTTLPIRKVFPNLSFTEEPVKYRIFSNLNRTLFTVSVG